MDEEHAPSHIVPFEHQFVEHYPDGLESHFHHPDEEFIEHVHHHCHTDRPDEDILHHHHTLPWWADGTNWTHTTSSEVSSDIESEPPADYEKLESIDRPQSHATCFSVIGILVLILLGGGVALLIFLLPPYPDDRPKGCDHFPPRFGLNCEFRCHCFNLSEVCDKLTGQCESGCMSGWRGQDCQIIYSIFDKLTINAKSQSRHTVTCSIFKLWYNMSTVTLTVYNGTETHHKIEVLYLETVSTSDPRLNARLSKASRIEEADNITFSFEFREDDCDLGGLYECQFDMVEQFNTSFANLSVFVQDSSHGLQIETKTEYVEGSMDNITCSLQLVNPTSTVELIFTDNENKTRNSTSLLIKEEVMTSDAKCTNLTYFVYQFKAIKELNGLMAKCSLVDELSGETMESDGSLISVITGIVNVQTVLEPKHQVAFLGSTAEMFCHANSSGLKWNVIHLNYTNSSYSQILISIYYNKTVQMNTNIINATIINNDENLNISYIFDIDKDEMVCLLDGEYECDIEFIDDSIQTTNGRGTLEVATQPMVTKFLVKDIYYSKSNHSFSCRATFDDNANGTLEIQMCSEKSYKPIIDDPAFALKETIDEDVPGMCTRQISTVYNINFTQATNGTFLRCLATDHNMNMSATTECLPLVLQPPVFAEMIPTLLYARIDSTTELMCSIYYRGYAWSSVNILQQNTTGSVLLLNASSDGKVESKNPRINGSMIRNDDYINVTVSFDVSPGSGVCELNQTYSCEIQLMDPSIGTTAANSTLVLEIPVTDVRIHLQPEYQYGTLNWINCTANTKDGSTASLSLEVCHNETTFIPIENITTSMPIEDVSATKNENCSVQKMLSHTLVFNKQMNVSFRCRVDDDYNEAPLTSNCIKPNISPASVQIMQEPGNQSALLGSTVEMFCLANASIFKWRVIHLDFRNTSSLRRLISVYYNETKQGLENVINATLISKDGIVNISYVFNISDDEMVCFMDGEISCDLEFLDDAIQKTYVKGFLVVSARPKVTDFMVQNYYNSESIHNFSCTATFDDNADISLEIQLCKDNSFKPITEDSAFALSASSDQEITGKCTRQKSVVYNFNFTQVSNGTLLRCLATDHNLNISATTECLPLVLKPPVFAEMIPTVLYARIDSTTELMCSIYYRGYAWSSINILQQNTTGSVLLLNASSDGKVESKNARIIGSMIRNDDYINVTVSFDVSPGSGVCELNQTYSCEIQLMDSSIGTTAANSTLVLEIPVTDIRIHLQPEYQYGTLNWINCTANTMDGSTATLSLEVCQNETTFIPIENITISMPIELVSMTKNENCSVQKMLSHSMVFNKQMNVSYRCRIDDGYHKASLMSSCILLNVLPVLVHIFLEPKEQIGLTNSTSEVICYANISAFEWRAVHLSYTNVSYSRIIISVFPNYTNPLVENGVTARIFNTDEIVNISFVLQLKEVPVLCNINLKLSCIVEFLDDFIETTTDIGNILITAPPENLMVETMPDEYEYNGNINETINCTANINPNTTVLSLVGKRTQTLNEYFFAERRNLQIFVDSENKTGCNPTVRVVFFKLGYFLKDYNWLGCIANDTQSGKSSVTEFKYVAVSLGIQ